MRFSDFKWKDGNLAERRSCSLSFPTYLHKRSHIISIGAASLSTDVANARSREASLVGRAGKGRAALDTHTDPTQPTRGKTVKMVRSGASQGIFLRYLCLQLKPYFGAYCCNNMLYS